MALRKRSYTGDKWLETAMHNSRVDAQNERKARQQDKKRKESVAGKLRGAGIHESWTSTAIKIMDRDALGLNQVASRVAPEIKRIIRQQDQEEREKREEQRRSDEERAAALAAADKALGGLNSRLFEELSEMKESLANGGMPAGPLSGESRLIRYHRRTLPLVLARVFSETIGVLALLLVFLFGVFAKYGEGVLGPMLLSMVTIIILYPIWRFLYLRRWNINFNKSAANRHLRDCIDANYLRACREIHGNHVAKCALDIRESWLPKEVRIELQNARALLRTNLKHYKTVQKASS